MVVMDVLIPHCNWLRGAPVVKQGRVAFHQRDGEPLEKPLFFASLSGQSTSQFLQLCFGYDYESSKTLITGQTQII